MSGHVSVFEPFSQPAVYISVFLQRIWSACDSCIFVDRRYTNEAVKIKEPTTLIMYVYKRWVYALKENSVYLIRLVAVRYLLDFSLNNKYHLSQPGVPVSDIVCFRVN